jgi:hypothetical protein
MKKKTSRNWIYHTSQIKSKSSEILDLNTERSNRTERLQSSSEARGSIKITDIVYVIT